LRIIGAMKTLLIGGARSGKSSLATRWAGERSNDVCCIVTATVSDEEMSARIAAHRLERPQHWRTREEPIRLAAALRDEAATNAVLLVDCLTLWTANCLWPPHRLPAVAAGAPVAQPNTDLGLQPDLAGWQAERAGFLAALHEITSEVIIVSNEVGTGLVPEHAAARLFRDEQGRLNQRVATACDAAFLVTAGLALRLK
jgi:adenosylcobinamide kinase/adenosylcobinamide-phosphate guanylyltransferase